MLRPGNFLTKMKGFVSYDLDPGWIKAFHFIQSKSRPAVPNPGRPQQELRHQGVVRQAERRLTLLSLCGSMADAGFDPDYLGLDGGSPDRRDEVIALGARTPPI